MDSMRDEGVSVIVPCFNREVTLLSCLSSIYNQTYKKLQIINIDDGSTDETGIILDEQMMSDERTIVIHQRNCGASSSRNSG